MLGVNNVEATTSELANMKFQLNLYEGARLWEEKNRYVYDLKSKTSNLSWAELVDLLGEKCIVDGSKEEQYMFNFCIWKDDAEMIFDEMKGRNYVKKIASNVKAVCALVLDYDNGISIAEFTQKYKDKFAYILYTTYSHKVKSPGYDRYRVIIPLKEILPATLLNRSGSEELITSLSRCFETVGSESWDLSRGFHVSGCLKEYIQHAQVYIQEGEAFDWKSLEVRKLHDKKAKAAHKGGKFGKIILESFDVVSYFRDHGLYGHAKSNGRHVVSCPKWEEHTDQKNDGACIYEKGAALGGGWAFRCLHNHRLPSGERAASKWLIQHIQETDSMDVLRAYCDVEVHPREKELDNIVKEIDVLSIQLQNDGTSVRPNAGIDEDYYVVQSSGAKRLKRIKDLTPDKKADLGYLHGLYEKYKSDGLANSEHGGRIEVQIGNVKKEIEKNIRDLEKKKEAIIRDDKPVLNGAERPAFPYIESYDSGMVKVINHSENTAALLDYYGIICRYNELKKEAEILIPGKTYHADTRNTAILTDIKDYCNLHSMPTSNIDEHLTKIANINVYNPVRDWLSGLEWDGKSRINELVETVRLDARGNEDIFKLFLTRWLVLGVKAILDHKGISARLVLTFVGRQNIGKTTWIKTIIPNQEWVSTDLTLDPHNKDDVIRFVKNWVVELGELDATFRKSDVAALKSFISRDHDEFRVPYGKKSERYARRTIFYASVNEPEFLNDTENTRFLPVPVMDVNIKHNLDVNQLWAEAKHLYEKGERHYLDMEETNRLNEYNQQFVSISPAVEALLNAGLRKPEEGKYAIKMNISGMFERALYTRHSRGDANSVGKWLRQNGFKELFDSKKRWLVDFMPCSNWPSQSDSDNDNIEPRIRGRSIKDLLVI